MEEKLCACGKPLHYVNAAVRALVEEMIEMAGDEAVVVRTPEGAWLVQRHYIALHGLRAWELPGLGFTKVQGDKL